MAAPSAGRRGAVTEPKRVELRALVPDRPFVLAEVSDPGGEYVINISDARQSGTRSRAAAACWSCCSRPGDVEVGTRRRLTERVFDHSLPRVLP